MPRAVVRRASARVLDTATDARSARGSRGERRAPAPQRPLPPQPATASARLAQPGGSGGGNVDAVFNQGVILFNGGKSGEAKPLFEQVVKSNPEHAEAHYMLGMSMAGRINEAE